MPAAAGGAIPCPKPPPGLPGGGADFRAGGNRAGAMPAAGEAVPAAGEAVPAVVGAVIEVHKILR